MRAQFVIPVLASILILGGLVSVTPLFAVPFPIINHSFEDPVVSDGGAIDFPVPGWGTNVISVIVNPNTSPRSPAPDGENIAAVKKGSAPVFGFIFQETGNVEANKKYTLTVNHINGLDQGDVLGRISIGEPIAIDFAKTDFLSTQEWNEASVTWDSTGDLVGAPLAIFLYSLEDKWVHYDNIRLEITEGDPLTVPSKITDLSLTAISPTQVDLSWTIPDDGGSPITGYLIQRKIVGFPGETLDPSFGDATTTSFSDTTLSLGDEVQYRIAAINAEGQGPFSNVPAPVTTEDDVIGQILNSIAQLIADLAQEVVDRIAGDTNLQNQIDNIELTPGPPVPISVSAPPGSSTPGCEDTNECFVPFRALILVGGTVIWFNDDTAAHTVTSGTAADGPDGIFDSSLLLAGATFEVTFDEAGVFEYFCLVHPWMVGEVHVI